MSVVSAKQNIINPLARWGFSLPACEMRGLLDMKLYTHTKRYFKESGVYFIQVLQLAAKQVEIKGLKVAEQRCLLLNIY